MNGSFHLNVLRSDNNTVINFDKNLSQTLRKKKKKKDKIPLITNINQVMHLCLDFVIWLRLSFRKTAGN